MRQMRMAWAMGIAAWACGGAGPGGAEPVVRDSAGVRIVENPDVARSPDEGTLWELTEEPVLVIGALEAAPEYQFNRVRGVIVKQTGTSFLRPDLGVDAILIRFMSQMLIQ